ncbi:MAG: DUF4965 domain-containing protein [Clostridia bacterium]|nr:DUF4965 domain-containing protein [Clostridia bacterium]
MKFRPAAIPLITVDPFFSVWSCSDALYSRPTEHWSGKLCPIEAGVYVGNNYYTVAGFNPNGSLIRSRIYQRDVKITPTSTIYEFENELVKLQLTFTSPLLLDRIDILSRPVSYVSYKIEKKCDETVRFLFGISTRGCVNNRNQNVVVKKTPFSLCCGNAYQSPLAQSGDNVMIDWGYLHLCDKDAKVGKINDDTYKVESLPINNIYNPYFDAAFLFTVKNETEGVITLAYDEIKAVEYLGKQLDEYYTKYFKSFEDMVAAAIREYPEIKKLCDKFDESLTKETAALGENYKNITALAYRQSISAHKLVSDTDGNLLFLSKENDSNGCIATLDVTHPSVPLYLKFNPELVNGMLRPILKYASSAYWNFDFTPHDLGQYPIANGQFYSADVLYFNGEHKSIGAQTAQDQMPIEEAGNMLICLAAVKKYSGKQSLFEEYKTLLKSWADYLVEFGYDPANQLCTDDFAGHLARNCNLSVKAILGIAAYAELSGDDSYLQIAKKYAAQWEIDAKASHGSTRLSFDLPDSWSIKYNLAWDSVLGYNLFSEKIKRQEIKTYLSKLNRYGVPLDCRSDYTKTEWMMFSTRICDDKAYFDAICQSIVNMINETFDRVPFTDWHYSKTADHRMFRARSVVGGVFINLLK